MLLLPPLVTALLVLGVGLLANAPLSPLEWARPDRRKSVRTVSGEMTVVSFLETVTLILVPVLPLVMAAALLPRRWRELVVRLAPWASLPALIAAAVSPSAMLDLPWLLLGIRLGVDGVGQVFLFFTAVLWLLAGIYARSYLAGDAGRTRFFAFYLLTMGGNLGLIVAQDVLSFYLFFALMSFSSYGLIVHKRDPEAYAPGASTSTSSS